VKCNISVVDMIFCSVRVTLVASVTVQCSCCFLFVGFKQFYNEY